MKALRLVTAPAGEPVSLADMKAQLRVDISDDNALIMALIAAAREHIEKTRLSSALITQTWELVLSSFPGGDVIKLPRPPLQSVTSIKYYDEDDNESTFASSNYLVDADSFPGRIVLKSTASWPTTTLREVAGVVIQFVAGYGDDATAVPNPVIQALKLIVGDLYENRENTIVAQGVTIERVPLHADMLLNDFRNKKF